MAVVDVEFEELKRLVGRDVGRDELVDDLFSLGVELEYEEDGVLGLEVVPDRPDRLSVEGLARSLRYYYGVDEGIHIPDVGESDYTITVEENVAEVRPYVTGAVVRGLDLGGGVLDSLIQLQEKLHSTLGRRRNKGAIGVHDLAMIKGHTITYRGIGREEDSFVPLEIGGEEAREMTPGEVMTDHPVGRDYAYVLEGSDRVPAIYDDIGLFSFPPVINGKRTEVREDTRDVLVEMTGTDGWTIDKMLNVLLYTLDARGAEIEEVVVDYPDRRQLKPDFGTKTKRVEHDRVEAVLGVEFSREEVVDLLRRSGMEVEVDGDYVVEVPPYRTDVIHPLDVVDDVGRAYGFNELEPRYPDVSTIGELTESTRLENAVRRQLVGLGFQDLLNFVLTSPEQNYEVMRLGVEGDGVYVENPYSEEYSMMRSWLLPSLVTVLGNNTHRGYPQELAEVGVCARQGDTETGVRESTRAAAIVCGAEAGYEDVKSRLRSLVEDFDASLETPSTEHPSFVPGRAADVVVDGRECGVIGEIHPEVLAEHEVAMPAAGFEFDVEALMND